MEPNCARLIDLHGDTSAAAQQEDRNFAYTELERG
jgi:hypothetical protein